MTSSRFGFGLGPGSTTAYGWPKKGGIYVLNGCFGINLKFLWFDRLGEETDLKKEMRLNNEQEEEAHCNKSKFCQKNKENFSHAHLGNFCSALARSYMVGKLPCSRNCINKRWQKYDDVLLYIGWPTSGGLWVLSMTQREAYDLERPSGLIYYNARDPDEQCGMIERLGGTFYEDPSECPYLDLANDTSSEHSDLTALKGEGAQNQI